MLAVIAGLALTGLVVALAAGEGPWGFGAAAVLGAAVGAGLWHWAAPLPAHAERTPAAPRIVALAWLLGAVVAAVPFWAAGTAPGAGPAVAVFADPANALFEAMSGLTSTGLSVSPDAGALPASVQWWRSLLQWVGGIGILYVALALVPSHEAAELDGELDEEMDTQTSGGGRQIGAIWALYAGYTVAAAIAFWAVGMPPWEAVNHAMTSLATGGFDVTGDSFAGYSRPVHAVGVVAMALGAVSFGVHFLVVARGRFGAFRDGQNGLMAALLVVGAGALAAVARDGGTAWPDAAFQWTSALLTAGFSTERVGGYGTAALLVLVVGMVIGGAAGSTAGGLKQRRAAALLRWATGGRRDEGPAALRQLGRIGAALAAGAILLWVLTGAAPVEALFETASALGTVGLSTGLTGPDLPVAARILLTALMWAGRLEVAAVLALFVGRR